jgi:hypothetical protein
MHAVHARSVELAGALGSVRKHAVHVCSAAAKRAVWLQVQHAHIAHCQIDPGITVVDMVEMFQMAAEEQRYEELFSHASALAL